MKKKILTFVFLLIIAGIVMIAGHEIERHMHKAEQNTVTTEVSVDYNKDNVADYIWVQTPYVAAEGQGCRYK